MPTAYPELFAELGAPFHHKEVKTRNQGGRQLSYITARTAANRLDDVLGPENWWPEFTARENSVECRLTIRLPDGTTLTKVDAGAYAGMADHGDDDKSGYSDALKRAAAMFGVGRYLYRDGVPRFVAERTFAGEVMPGSEREAGSDDDREAPSRRQPARAGAAGHQPGRGQGGGQHQGAPRSGKGLFAFCKEQEQIHQVGLIKYLNGWAESQEFPGRMIDWDAEQVELGYKEACRKLQSLEGPPTTGYEEALAN